MDRVLGTGGDGTNIGTTGCSFFLYRRESLWNANEVWCGTKEGSWFLASSVYTVDVGISQSDSSSMTRW